MEGIDRKSACKAGRRAVNNNLEVRYLYRDGSNNKKYQSVVIANPDGITPEQLEDAIRSRFSDLQVWPDILHFRPEALGWPTAYFPGHDMDRDDLDVHEFDGVELSQSGATIDYDLKRILAADI